MAIKKVKKDLWERLFIYPSFNIRFKFTVGFIIFIFLILTALIFNLKIVHGASDQISTLNLMVQLALLVLGILAAYYALRQLVETRFNTLDQAAMEELKRKHYSRAFEKWREAFYIKPEADVFANMCETLLFVGDYDTFDQNVRISKSRGFLKKKVIQETSDQIILLYLKAIRHLFVKNQGKAEKYIADLIGLVKNNNLLGFYWDFLDLQTSTTFQDLNGECKNIAENLVDYLSKNIQSARKTDFESGNYASQIPEATAEKPAPVSLPVQADNQRK